MNGLRDAFSQTRLAYMRVFPVGKTEPIRVEWVAGMNEPMQKPLIRVKLLQGNLTGFC